MLSTNKVQTDKWRANETRNGKTAKRCYRNGKSKRNKNSNNISGQIKYTLHIIWNVFSTPSPLFSGWTEYGGSRCVCVLLRCSSSICDKYLLSPTQTCILQFWYQGTRHAHTHKVHTGTGHGHRPHLPHIWRLASWPRVCGRARLIIGSRAQSELCQNEHANGPIVTISMGQWSGKRPRHHAHNKQKQINIFKWIAWIAVAARRPQINWCRWLKIILILRKKRWRLRVDYWYSVQTGERLKTYYRKSLCK